MRIVRSLDMLGQGRLSTKTTAIRNQGLRSDEVPLGATLFATNIRPISGMNSSVTSKRRGLIH